MLEKLKEYIADQRRLDWAWGERDCTLFAGDWVRLATGRDPGAGLRGTYETEDQALMIVAQAGGMEAFVGLRLERLGFMRVQEPRDGDVGVVIGRGLLGDQHEVRVPAIRFGPLWAVRFEAGVRVTRMPMAAAWRIA